MMIAMIEGCTRVCGKSQGYLGLPVRDVIINDKVNGITRVMETAWTPTPDELERLNKGANVILRILGTSPPPQLIEVGPIPEQPEIELCDQCGKPLGANHACIPNRR